MLFCGSPLAFSKTTVAVLVIAICAVSSPVLSAVTVWSPRWTTAFTLFLNDQVPILYGCTYGDDKCEQSTFKVSVWQKGAIFSGHVDDVGIVTPRTYWTTWKIPKTLTPGGYFYFYIDNGNGYTQSSSYFEIRRQGFYLDTPDVPSIWLSAPSWFQQAQVSRRNAGLLERLTTNVDYVLRNEATASDVKVGSTMAVTSTLTVPNSVLSTMTPGWYSIIARADSETYGQSAKFLIARNQSIACDLSSVAVQFSTEVYSELKNNKQYDFCGYVWTTQFQYSLGDDAVLVVSSPGDRSAVVAFRGTTASVSDWTNTFSITGVPCSQYLIDGCNGGDLHAGFARTFNVTVKEIRRQISQMLSANYDVVLTGHSKGAAIATIQALDAAQLFPKQIKRLHLITVGGPRVGGEKFAATFQKQAFGMQTLRYINYGDPIPSVPPTSLGYCHVSKCIYLSELQEEKYVDRVQSQLVAFHGVDHYQEGIVLAHRRVRLTATDSAFHTLDCF